MRFNFTFRIDDGEQESGSDKLVERELKDKDRLFR